jgi:hypothetical protein
MTVIKLSIGIALLTVISHPGIAGDKKDKAAEATEKTAPVLWRDPTDIVTRDLFYGPGGKEHEPRGEFTFVKEDLDGTNPKFVIKDADGVHWKVKLGLEARPETVASRIVWAAGFFVNEDYFLPEIQIKGMPERLHRGRELVTANGSMKNVRLKRESKDEKKAGEWKWKDNPFKDTRELNGLKVMMALVNNWDLKDENNAVYKEGSDRIYMVSDLGASFGTAGRSWPKDKAKGNLEGYQQSKFIRRESEGAVDFRVPARPAFEYLVNPKEYIRRVSLESIGHKVPRADAKWMGQLLARLSANQILDAFRSAGYTPGEAAAFAAVLQSRITMLTDL